MNFKDYIADKDINLLEISKACCIPYATLHKGIEKPESLKIENLKKISDYLSISMDELYKILILKEDKKFLKMLREQKRVKLKGNIYHSTQIKFSYNSNRIEGSRLSEEETRYIFETNTIFNDKKTSNINDIIETANHFYLFDIMLNDVEKILSQKMIKEYHRILKNGTSDSRESWFNIGEYKGLPNEVGNKKTTSPENVQKEMEKLLQWYNSKNKIELEDIIEFHYRFESIHPFQDGNGRVGRIIIFKECLKNDIIPLIIEDDSKFYYYRGLSEYETEKGFLMETCLAMQDKYSELMSRFLEVKSGHIYFK